jgi:hypothetical protein
MAFFKSYQNFGLNTSRRSYFSTRKPWDWRSGYSSRKRNNPRYGQEESINNESNSWESSRSSVLEWNSQPRWNSSFEAGQATNRFSRFFAMSNNNAMETESGEDNTNRFGSIGRHHSFNPSRAQPWQRSFQNPFSRQQSSAFQRNWLPKGIEALFPSRIIDASGDSSKKEVFEDGALEISYNKSYLSNLKNIHAPEISIWGMEFSLPGQVSASVSATQASTGEVIDLGTTNLDLSKGSFYVNLKDQLEASEGWLDRRSSWNIDVDINANYANGLSVNLEDFDENITMVDALDFGSSYKGDATANTFTYKNYTSDFIGNSYDTGRIYRGRGGTDTLVLDGINKSDILEFNGSSVNQLGHSAAGGAALGEQAFYGGTVFDVLNLKNGDELYLQGIEKISCEDGDIRVRANMSDSTKDQWNLQAMDVSGAWRFNRGSSDVVLVSLDTGIGDIAGNATDIDDEIGHVVNKSSKNTSASASSRDHGHHSMSIMGAKHDSDGIAGIAPQSELWGYNVWADRVYSSIEDAKSERSQGQRLVFQNGAGHGWGGWGATEAEMRTSIEETNDYAFFSASAGNDGSTSGVAGAGGLAPFQTDYGNVASVGAVQFTSTEEVDNITNAVDTQIAWYSNEGDDLTISAPTDSRAINGDGDITDFGGTSCANPNLAGVAALVWSENTCLTGSDVRDLLTHSAMDLGDVGRDNTFGHGLVNAEAAVRRSHALAENKELANFYANDEFLA